MVLLHLVHKLLAIARARGLAHRDVLAGSGLSAATLADPTTQVAPEQFDQLLLQVLHRPETSDIAFALGPQTDLSDMGMIGYALHSSRSMRDALAIWLEYSNALTGSPLRLTLEEGESGEWALHVECQPIAPLLHRFYTEAFLVSGMQMFRQLALQAPALNRLSFDYAAPPHVAVYQQAFDCPLQFDARRTVLSFRAPGLDTPVRTNNEELHHIITEHCRAILHHMRYGTGVESRVRNLLLVNPRQLPGIDNTSSQLGLSQRTLRRRLEQNGHSYRQIKHDFRHDLALQYLASPYISVKEISHMLGYTSPSAFCRAFKQWTGCSPGDYRQQLTAPVTATPTQSSAAPARQKKTASGQQPKAV